MSEKWLTWAKMGKIKAWYKRCTKPQSLHFNSAHYIRHLTSNDDTVTIEYIRVTYEKVHRYTNEYYVCHANSSLAVIIIVPSQHCKICIDAFYITKNSTVVLIGQQGTLAKRTCTINDLRKSHYSHAAHQLIFFLAVLSIGPSAWQQHQTKKPAPRITGTTPLPSFPTAFSPSQFQAIKAADTFHLGPLQPIRTEFVSAPRMYDVFL